MSLLYNKRMENKHLSYLEEVEGIAALSFVKAENKKTTEKLQSYKHYREIEQKISKILFDKDRLVIANKEGNYLYNFWEDSTHVKGIWRRTTLDSYKTTNPEWELVLDIDKLSLIEKENWVWANVQFLQDSSLCMVSLSRGGKDAVVNREFNVETKSFVENGFNIPESKGSVTWIDKNSLYVCAALSEDISTDSGYPRIIKKLNRYEKIDDAEVVFSIEHSDLLVSTYIDRKSNTHVFSRHVDFYETVHYINNYKLPLDSHHQFKGIFNNKLIYVLISEVETNNKKLKSGSLVALDISKIQKEDYLNFLELIFEPTNSCFLSEVNFTKTYILLTLLENVVGKIKKYSIKNKNWTEEILFDQSNSVEVIDTSESNDYIFLSYSGFLVPKTISYLNVNNNDLTVLKTKKESFNADNLVTRQEWVRSSDGTNIPYFIIHKKDMVLDGTNPTLLYGYGGFEVSLEPSYSSTLGSVWLEEGGVYVLANIRGGGEFGPQWHQAALKENRHKCFEDFIAIAEDLINKKITSPNHLGIKGGSNGGLLVGTVFTKRPDLFNAVICQVPLLDMLNYHNLLAGASWMAEYGNPDIEEEAKYLRTYSPLHNIKQDVKYPEMFLMTSTKDDRVHPCHARKMMAKLMEFNKDALYFENTEGGHGGTANIEQDVFWMALEYSYLFNKLK